MNENEQLDTIKNALAVLDPTTLEVENESHRHAGHGGWREGVLTHIHVKIASDRLEGLKKLAAHRLVMDILAPFMADFLHSARITIIGCKI